MRRAAIDVGSNSVLLLVEDNSDGNWKTICEQTDVTSLGAGVKKSGQLSEVSMVNTLAALSSFYKIARDLEVTDIRCAATMAARIAHNTDDFLVRARAQNTPVVVLSGDDEAQLGFLAVATDPTFANHQRISVIDVGGQSTEVVTAQRDGPLDSTGEAKWRTLFRRSFPIGTLALKGGPLQAECPSPTEILSAVVELDDAIGLCYRRDQCGAAVCVGATGTNLVAIREKISAWDPARVHGSWLDFGEISEQVGRLMRLTESERRDLVGIEPGRAATLPGGALILERILNAIGAPGSFVTTRGWRHALLEFGYPSG